MQERKIGIGLSLLFVAILVVTAGILTWPKQVEAQDQCHQINSVLTSVADLNNFTTEGEIKSGFLKGTTRFTGDPGSLTQIESEVSPPVNVETYSYTGDLVITTTKGTLTTRSVGVFEGAPFGLGAQFDRVIAGSELFQGATGFLYFDFVADATGSAYTSSVTGEICVN